MGTPLLTIAQHRLIEQDMREQLGAGVLMARAGAAAAALIASRWPKQNTRILIACGPGDNGGDGFSCALALAEAGYQPTVIAPAPSQTPDAQAVRKQWLAHHSLESHLPDLSGYSVIVDALFGIGLTRPLQAPFSNIAMALSTAKAHLLALDCPSGLDADRGRWLEGTPQLRAHTTLTFLAAKPGLYTGAALDACGQIIIEPLGLADAMLTPSVGQLNEPSAFFPVCSPRLLDTHKGNYGAVAVIGGNTGMIGAALLAARAALRLGAGRVYVDAISPTAPSIDPQQPELMFQSLARIPHANAIVIGCGLGQDNNAKSAYAAASTHPATKIIDADALTLAAGAWPADTIITPHPLEVAKLLHCGVDTIQADRIAAARALAEQTQGIVILKGAGSVIATPEQYWINTTGGPALASAGSGDVLAGMIGALCAQGFKPAHAALAATWLHGASAQRHGADIGLNASEIAHLAAAQLADLRRHQPN